MLYGEADIQATIDALEQEERPAVSVSLDQLKNLRIDTREVIERSFAGTGKSVLFDEKDKYIKTAKLNPLLPMLSPYDQWRVWDANKSGVFFPKTHIYEERYAAQKISQWVPYITTTFLQMEPSVFLEYLRLMLSTKGNPWVEPVFYGENTKGHQFQYIDVMTVEKHDVSDWYPPLVMYPHTIAGNGDFDFSIILDRFTETVVWYALNQSFTALDIARTNDPKLLERAYSAILNRSPYIKSQVSETSVVTLIKDGKPYKKFSVSIHPDMQKKLKQVIDDNLILIRQNADKLAERAIEVRQLQAQGIKADFVGPEWLNPLTLAKMSEKEISAKMQLVPLSAMTKPAYNLPASLMPVYYPAPVDDISEEAGVDISLPEPKKKTNFLLPIAGAAAAALGIYAITR